MAELIIAPSVLSLDFTDTKAQLKGLKESDAKWIHFDVMDGTFVPNISFGPDILKHFAKATNMFMDVHVMIQNPLYYAPIFIEAGANMYTFHYEAVDSLNACEEIIDKVHELGCKCGISLKPNTPISVLDTLLEKLDMVLIMSVEPGFGGQSFMEDMLDKVRYLKQKQETTSYFHIQIDGGINAETAKLAVDAGCDVLVAGSYIFKQDIAEGVTSLLCLK